MQVLGAAPAVESITVVGPLQGAQTTVSCNTQRACVTLVGELQQGQRASVEVRGSNLPASLRLELSGCESVGAARDLLNTSLRLFQCTPRTEGTATLRLLTGPANEGGTELLASPVTVQ